MLFQSHLCRWVHSVLVQSNGKQIDEGYKWKFRCHKSHCGANHMSAELKVFPVDLCKGRIFLAKKARGFGCGKWVGFGGKLEAAESEMEGALRELREETGIGLDKDQLEKIGVVMYTFSCTEGFRLEMHVYLINGDDFDQVMSLNDEFIGPGKWFNRDNIPFDEMWNDFVLWNNNCFDNQRFRARIHYHNYSHVESYVYCNVTDQSDKLQAQNDWR